MAGSAVIGALRVVLGADTAAFESGLKSAQGQANSFASAVTKIAAGIGLERGLEKVIEGIVHGFKEAIKSADDMGKMASKVGLPVEELSKLKLAADLSDVSMESLSTGLGKLSKAMVEVARGGGDAASLAFRQLGVEVKNSDGTLRSTGDVLADIAGKFGELKDGAAKTAVAIALFGKGGKDLIPLLNEGKAGLEEMMHAAEKMGLVISKDTAAQAQKFNDNIKLLDAAKQGLTNTIVAQLLPALVRLSDQWVDTAKDGTVMRTAADTIVAGIKEMIGWFAAQAVGAQFLGEALGHLWEAIKALPTSLDEAAEHMRRLNQTNMEAPAAMKAAGDAAVGMFTQITVEAKKLNDLNFDANVQKAIEDLGFKTRILKNEFAGLAVGFPELAKGLGIFGEAANENRNTVALLTPQLLALNTAQQAFKAAQITQENLQPWVAYEQQIARLQILLDAGAISHDTFARAVQKAGDTAGVTWQQIGANIAGTMGALSSLTATLGKENKAMMIVSKAFALGQVAMNTAIAVSKAIAMFGPPPSPAGIAGIAFALATGAAQAATIVSQGMAKGGSFMVPGGKSMTDNMMVPLNLASGERVDITPANDVGSRGGRGGNTVIELHGERFSRDQVRDLFETINSGLADGHKFKVA